MTFCTQSITLATSAYTPGYPAFPHSIPHETTPMSLTLDVLGSIHVKGPIIFENVEQFRENYNKAEIWCPEIYLHYHRYRRQYLHFEDPLHNAFYL